MAGVGDRGRVLAVAACVLVALGPAGAVARADRGKVTWLLSRSRHGGLPNGASCCGVVSHDERIGRVMAFESLATDITAGVGRGLANVYVVFRRAPWASNGTRWVPGRTVLASHGLAGRPANGASFAPALGGDSGNVPRCVAFLSRASNLVAGDHNRRTDAFVEDLQSRRIVRVSVDSAGREANGTTSGVAVSGDCKRVAFVSDATNLAAVAASGRWPGARTRVPRAGTRQVYLHFLGGFATTDRALAGLTMLVSANRAVPANADAGQVSLSRDGKAVAFVSAATNLGHPSGGVAQVWERTLAVGAAGPGAVRVVLQTRLVSMTAAGAGGGAPSSRPSVDHDGRVLAFQSLAPDLLPGANGLSQIIRATVGPTGSALDWVSRSATAAGVGDGPSYDASISDGGEWVFFDSTMGNFGSGGVAGQPPGPRVVLRWTVPALATLVDHSHLAQESVGGPFGGLSARTPSEHPDTSARGNYVPFESDDPGLDQTLPDRSEPPWYPGGAIEHDFNSWWRPYQPALQLPAAPQGALTGLLPGSYGTPDGALGDPTAEPRLHQVYVRDVGTA